jgi:N-acetylglutamate synthase
VTVAARLAKHRLFAELVDGAWLREGDGAYAMVWGVPAAGLNAVVATAPDPPVAAVEELLDAVAATGLPYSLRAPPGELAAVAARRGMIAAEALRVMRLDALEPATAPGLTVRALAPEEAPLGVGLQAACFEAPAGLFEPLTTPRMLAAPGVRTYVGEVAGEPVATAMGITGAEDVAILNVATLPAHRRRGYGAAITAWAVADGLASGARWAWLECAPAAEPFYERLGFRREGTQNTFTSSQSAAK